MTTPRLNAVFRADNTGTIPGQMREVREAAIARMREEVEDAERLATELQANISQDGPLDREETQELIKQTRKQARQLRRQIEEMENLND